MKVWIAHEDGRALLGEVPDGVTVEVYTGRDGWPGSGAGVEFWVPPFLSGPDTIAVSEQLPDLRVVQLMSAGADRWVDRLPPGVTLCDGRGIHDSSTAEWAAAAILTCVRGFPRFVRAQDQRQWTHAEADELAGKRVLIVGSGSIGAALTARLEPFGVTVTRVARRARPGVHAVGEVLNLLPDADVVVLLVPLTAQTRGLVDAKFLGAMPDGALLVNAARGPVVDTAALVAECASGRLRAAVDVTDPEPLPADHPLWGLPNVFLTPHVAGTVPGLLVRAYRLIGTQLRRYLAGEPLDNVVGDGY